MNVYKSYSNISTTQKILRF